MKAQQEQRYEHPINDVFDAFSDQNRLEEKLQFLGSRNVSILKMDRQTDSLDIEISREVPAEAPSAFKKFIADWNAVKQRENWTREGNEIKADFKVEMEGIPVNMGGTMTLVDEGSTTLHRVELVCDCKIPLVGKKLAEFVCSKSEEAVMSEFAFWVDNLKR